MLNAKPDNAIRALSADEAKKLGAGADHYMAYVGPPAQYDFMDGTQFRLLAALGLRDHHKLLDFGCGSLRAGKLLIPYLQPGNYHGLEPNRWLIEDAIERELGRDLIRLKRPVFNHNEDFVADAFGVTFDFILAQSIFSHAGPEIIAIVLKNFARCLADWGLVLATFVHPGPDSGEEQACSGWIYPGCYCYRPDTILGMIRSAGLFGALLPWFHPRQFWYAMALNEGGLPSLAKYGHLSGAVLRDPEFA